MKLIVLSLLTLLALVAEPLIARPFSPAVPNVLILPLIMAVLICPGSSAVLLGSVVGLLDDCLAASVIGPRMALFASIAALASCAVAPRRLSPLGVVASSFAIALALEAASSLVSHVVGSSTVVATSETVRIVASSCVTSLLLSGVWIAVRSLQRLFQGEQPDRLRKASIGWSREPD